MIISRRLGLVTLFAVLANLIGCNQQMEEFVRGATRANPGRTSNTAVSGQRFSAGSGHVTGTTVSASVSISPKTTALNGTTVGMRVGISRAPAKIH